MFPFITIIFGILILVNIYLYVSGIHLKKKLSVIMKRIADEEISYEIKKLETAFILEAYKSLKNATFQEKFLPGMGYTPPYKQLSVDEGYIIQKSFVSFVVCTIREINKKHKTDIKLNVVDGDFNLNFSQSLTVVKIFLLLAEKTIRKEIGSTSIFLLAHGPVQFSIEMKCLNKKAINFDFLLQDQLMNSSDFRILDNSSKGQLDRYVVGVSGLEAEK